MTLIVYKNNMLAADTRGTFSHSHRESGETCAHCGEVAQVVDDKGNKITFPSPDKDLKFRGSKILAIGQAGNRSLSKRLVALIMEGKDLEEAYRNHMAFHGPAAEHSQTSSFLICCEDANYVVRIPKKGNLEVEKGAKDGFVAIGACPDVADWLNTLMPDASAAAIINLVMAKDKSVGGLIHEINLAVTPLKLNVYEKKDPARLLTGAVEIFKTGKEAVRANEIKAAIKPARTRKPVRKAPTV
jgi:hypothetical protein